MTNIDHNSAVMWLLVLKVPMALTTDPFPYLGVGQNRGKAPGERKATR